MQYLNYIFVDISKNKNIADLLVQNLHIFFLNKQFWIYRL